MTPLHNYTDRLLEECLERLQINQENVETILAEYPLEADRLRPALEAAAWLITKSGRLDPRPGFVDASQHQIICRLQMASSQVKRGFMQQLRLVLQSKRAVQFALVVLLIAVLLTGNTVAMASHGAIPGDSTYPFRSR